MTVPTEVGGEVPAVSIVPLEVERDAAMLHAWVTHPRSVYWEMQDAGVDDVAREYAAILTDDHHEAFIGLVDGRPEFLVERYDPRHGPLAGLPEIEEADVGMHLLVAPTEQPQHGFTRAVMRAVMRFCFADPAVRRVVVEPDVRNEAIAELNEAAGFVVLRHIVLATKTAALSIATRESFAHSDLESELAR
jgi:RimJ/RimL family protein N-acetyltransferase